jgi:hypothetical protein
LTLCLTLTHFAAAQRGGGFGGRGGFGGTTSRVRLAAIEKVQTELKLSDEQKTAAKEISDKLSEESRDLRGGGGGGDRAAMLEKSAKLNADADEKLAAKLDDAQKKRLTEIFIQINGTSAVTDKAVSAALKVTEEQQKELAEVNAKNRQARMEAFQNFRDMSPEERTEATAKLTKASDELVMAVLDAAQREQFGKMKGQAFEIDRALLRGGRGGRRGAGGANN